MAEAAPGRSPGKTAIISPTSLEVVKRIDRVFEIERNINVISVAERLAVRQERIALFVGELESLIREQCVRSLRHGPVAKTRDHMLTRGAASPI
jgi:hypothetical protein